MIEDRPHPRCFAGLILRATWRSSMPSASSRHCSAPLRWSENGAGSAHAAGGGSNSLGREIRRKRHSSRIESRKRRRGYVDP